MASRFKQGLYIPKNPEKYVGDVSKIRYMSSWELKTHEFFDNNTKVVRWSSEEIFVPYIKPTDNKIHKYYPDYWIEYINNKGELAQELIEVKPHAQTRMPRTNSKHRLYEQLTFAVNNAKWASAVEFCRTKNMTFRILTEKSIFR